MKAVLPLLLVVAATAAPALAGEACVCRAPGFEVAEGETVCLKTPHGPRLARCERVLNNTSWVVLEAPCPSAMGQPATPDRSAIADAAPAGTPLLR